MKLFRNLLVIAIIVSMAACQSGDQSGQDESIEKYGQVFKGKVAKSYEESEEWWPSSPKPPEGTPNVILFLLDDTGFGHLGSFGGLTETANID